MVKHPDLTADQHAAMAQRLRDAVNDYYTELPDDDDTVIGILALTLTLDGPKWLEELPAR